MKSKNQTCQLSRSSRLGQDFRDSGQMLYPSLHRTTSAQILGMVSCLPAEK